MYCTPAQLADSDVRAQQLALLFGIDQALLVATVTGTPRDAWGPDEIALADAALASMQAELERATGEADARLARRGYTLPADPVRFPVLVVWTRAIARYHLNAIREGKDFNEDNGRIERDYRDARQALDLIAAGKLSLGAGDPLAVPGEGEQAGAIRITSQPRMFNRRTLGGF